mmetsp:Transcript_9308/g.15854  ORF Transcript_9308/g.15854 Transcript_9308/m.15854 type:complete len:155 (+) Transcript_9308:28-492(+)
MSTEEEIKAEIEKIKSEGKEVLKKIISLQEERQEVLEELEEEREIFLRDLEDLVNLSGNSLSAWKEYLEDISKSPSYNISDEAKKLITVSEDESKKDEDKTEKEEKEEEPERTIELPAERKNSLALLEDLSFLADFMKPETAKLFWPTKQRNVK